MHVILAPLYNILHDDIFFHRNEEHKSSKLKTLKRKHPNFILVDSSAIGVGTVLVQVDDEDRMHVISCNSRNFTGSEQKIVII